MKMTTPSSPLLQKNQLWKTFGPILAILALVVGALFFIKKYFAHLPKENSVEIQVGSTLPDFTLTRFNGSTVSVSELKAKVHLLNFWATWCEACVEEMPSIIKLRDAFKSRGFEVLGINLDENPELALSRAKKELGIDFPTFKDLEGKVAELFDVHAIPFTIVFNRERKVLYIKNGEQDWNSPEMRTQLDRWLSQ
jgi:peroxiredoxin